jgi:hypothetical protein
MATVSEQLVALEKIPTWQLTILPADPVSCGPAAVHRTYCTHARPASRRVLIIEDSWSAVPQRLFWNQGDVCVQTGRGPRFKNLACTDLC